MREPVEVASTDQVRRLRSAVSDSGTGPRPPIHEETTQPRRKSERVTEQLLDAATAVFGERGFEAATVSEVARRCGMTSGAVYARWPNKRELFLAVIEHTSAQRMLLLIKQAETAADDKLEMLGANLLTSTRDEMRNLWIEACVSASRDPSVHPAPSARSYSLTAPRSGGRGKVSGA